ncbi:hypothetical protein [Clostridium cylindrosporum]|uniref:Uncharacterized protein n=1 Tax=Clostridium cylindrosporum DSM 605 TaxID=1121307 RepID=A0A0J8DG86_CLOCY|nr:hypothetical protein [Clostridium cylindrosporum]KMT23183.1 hypothetical protein CLCY_6c00640 [Clostridium cylindrosporum DSM 605]
MRFLKVERSIVKIGKDIAALKLAKKYLSNLEEIEDVQKDLNKKRQDLVNELYSEDSVSYIECVDFLDDFVGRNLERDEQLEVLKIIKETFGRECADAGKVGSGINAWLKKLNIDHSWIEVENSDWPSLLIKEFGVFNNIILD